MVSAQLVHRHDSDDSHAVRRLKDVIHGAWHGLDDSRAAQHVGTLAQPDDRLEQLVEQEVGRQVGELHLKVGEEVLQRTLRSQFKYYVAVHLDRPE